MRNADIVRRCLIVLGVALLSTRSASASTSDPAYPHVLSIAETIYHPESTNIDALISMTETALVENQELVRADLSQADWVQEHDVKYHAWWMLARASARLFDKSAERAGQNGTEWLWLQLNCRLAKELESRSNVLDETLYLNIHKEVLNRCLSITRGTNGAPEIPKQVAECVDSRKVVEIYNAEVLHLKRLRMKAWEDLLKRRDSASPDAEGEFLGRLLRSADAALRLVSTPPSQITEATIYSLKTVKFDQLADNRTAAVLSEYQQEIRLIVECMENLKIRNQLKL